MATHFQPAVAGRPAGLDAWAAGLSCLCLIHCLILPLAVVALPMLHVAVPGEESSELIHWGLIALAVPVSGFALWRGWRAHGRGRALALGGLGLGLLVAGALAHDLPMFAYDEQILTLAGGLALALAHWRNWRWRRERA